ncbi:plexin domain-containing protein 2 [Gouania willdenowi]|uniref:plexin domain-containing protein 2 n=1 Tax=Gouania willdenowi TaxID=441366 RepID=UPI00105527F4|nr:plexin domain-containing protein 2 [Gouania willdenowi]
MKAFIRFTCLMFALHVQTSFMKPTTGFPSTVAHEGKNSDVLDGNKQPRTRRWTFNSGGPGLDWTAVRKGHYSEDSDPDLLMDEGQENTSRIVDIDHVYYTSKFYSLGDVSKEFWINIDEEEKEQLKSRGFLFVLQRQPERVNLSFGFPFYGHLLKEVTVAPSGFIYTGDKIHQMLSATQYIAPLMANFNPSLTQNSSVFYFDNGTALVVQWDRVLLQNNISLGAFTFQAVLHSDGRIFFFYKQIPVDITDICSKSHPVKVGLSDAFMVLHAIEQIPNVRRRTIYEYHKVDIPKFKIFNCTAVEMIPLPTCLQFSSCGPCVTSQIGFNCSWCSRLQRCSSGFDRNRQNWVDHGCPEEVSRRDPKCVREAIFSNTSSHRLKTTIATAQAEQQMTLNWTATPFTKASNVNKLLNHHSSSRKNGFQTLSSGSSDDAQTSLHFNKATDGSSKGDDEQLRTGLLAGIAVMMIVMATAVIMSIYMYTHPTSSASLFFIERRPTHWPILKFRRGSGRPSYVEVEAPGLDKDGALVIDPKQSFVISDRRESEQREGFIIPDQRERFLLTETS